MADEHHGSFVARHLMLKIRVVGSQGTTRDIDVFASKLPAIRAALLQNANSSQPQSQQQEQGTPLAAGLQKLSRELATFRADQVISPAPKQTRGLADTVTAHGVDEPVGL